MSDISLPYKPRPDEDPRAASVVQANLEYLTSLFQKGTNDGDLMQWDATLGRYVAGQPDTGPFVPVGAIFMWPTTTAPTGFVLCDGSTYDGTIATYLDLWTVIGTTYGGSGQSSFAVPDLRGRIPVGKGSHADVDTLNDNDGASLSDRRPKHKHTVGD